MWIAVVRRLQQLALLAEELGVSRLRQEDNMR